MKIRIGRAFALSAFAALAASCSTPSVHQGAPIVLRVMSYNVKHGQGMTDRALRDNLEAQAAIIAAQRPDLVGLQEIDRLCRRSASIDEVDFFAQRTALHGAFGKFMSYDGGAYGLAILSRYETDRVEVLELPPGRHEPRVALIQRCEIHPKNGEMFFVNVHFDWLEQSKERVAQAERLVRRLRGVDRPIVVLGDYNATPDSPTLEVFRRAGFELVQKAGQPFTFSSTEPEIEIDHVCIRGSSRWRVHADPITVLPEREASDHLPILTNVYFTPR